MMLHVGRGASVRSVGAGVGVGKMITGGSVKKIGGAVGVGATVGRTNEGMTRSVGNGVGAGVGASVKKIGGSVEMMSVVPAS